MWVAIVALLTTCVALALTALFVLCRLAPVATQFSSFYCVARFRLSKQQKPSGARDASAYLRLLARARSDISQDSMSTSLVRRAATGAILAAD